MRQFPGSRALPMLCLVVVLLLSGCGALPTEAPAPKLAPAAMNQIEVARDLLESGADANIQDVGGRTAMHAAAEDGQTEVVRCLLEWGADADIQDVDGRTAMYAAAEDGQIEVVRYLLKVVRTPTYKM